jgi:hypothetical protein
VNLKGEEMRLKDGRMEHIPAQRRPYYQPIEWLAILELRDSRGWSLVQTADRMLVTPATVASWMGRLDDEGPGALVQLREPVNKFPDFVRYIVRRLKVQCPAMGKARIAQVLCRAGLHLSSATVGRMLREWPGREPELARLKATRRVHGNSPDHVWHVDLTTVPTSLSFWTAWLPYALPQHWPFCWWVAVAVDHYSKRIMGFAVSDRLPTSIGVREFLGRTIRRNGRNPCHVITDQGSQFMEQGFRRWCRRHNIR